MEWLTTSLLALGALVLLGAAALAGLVRFAPRRLLGLLRRLARRRAGLVQRSVRVGDHRIVYQEGGAGPPLLLLHGFGASKDMWTQYARPLLTRFRVIAPDLPGFGDSDYRPECRYGYREQAERMRAFVDALDLHRVHVGGNSMGGGIAGLFAAMHPERTESLLLMDAAAVDSPKPAEFVEHVERGENPLIVRRVEDVHVLLAFCFAHPPTLSGVAAHVFAADAIPRAGQHDAIFAHLLADGALLETALGTIRTRVLVMWGRHDRVIDRSTVDVLARALPDAAIIEYPDCGHLPCMEQPLRSARDHLAFLSS